MIKLNPWQWILLGLPLIVITGFLLIAAGIQIHAWGLNWIWAIFVFVFLGWRWLVVAWLKPEDLGLEAYDALNLEAPAIDEGDVRQTQAEQTIQRLLSQAQADGPPWQNWLLFFQRSQSLVEDIAHIYHPEAKRPLLNIYVPQAYGLLRGTVDDVDRWMQKLSPVLGKVTIGQAYEAYERYQKIEPAARLALKAWNWAQWVLNPVVAIARTASSPYVSQANQQLVANLGQIMREATLKALGERAIALYSGVGEIPPIEWTEREELPAKTQDLRAAITQALPETAVETAPIQVLVAGRTGAGKSSLINTLFRRDIAAIDVLPLTDQLTRYQYQTDIGERLLLWDAPGYGQIGRAEYRDQVLQQAGDCDILLLVTPALDPALKMDLDFLQGLQADCSDLPVIVVVTQVDRLRPFREWSPPYDWREGNTPKEIAMREAVIYRQETLGEFVEVVLPCVTVEHGKLTRDTAEQDKTEQGTAAQATGQDHLIREAWGVTELSNTLLELLEPAKQGRLARFLSDRESRTQSAARLIDRYVQQMSTHQGLTALLKSPILTLISSLMTGSPQLATLLATQLPLEQVPVVLGRLQLAYELYDLLADEHQRFDLLAIWPLALNTHQALTTETWAWGQTLVELWLQRITEKELSDRYQFYLTQN